MNYISLIITILALLVTVVSYYSGRKIKSLIISEKNMILDKVSDIKTTLQGHVNKVYNDRKTFSDEKRNTLNGVRIEDLESTIENLSRFEERLRNIK